MKYKLGDIIMIDPKYPEVGGSIGVITPGYDGGYMSGDKTYMNREGSTYYSVFMNERFYWVKEETFELADLTPLQKVFYEI